MLLLGMTWRKRELKIGKKERERVIFNKALKFFLEEIQINFKIYIKNEGEILISSL